MTEAITPNISKKLSSESKQLLDELATITTKATDLVPRLYNSLEKDGLGNSEIFGIIKEKIDISRARLYDLIPPEKKRPYKLAASKNVQKLDNQARLVVPEEPTIPPPPRVVREVEIVREPPKPVNEPISIPMGDRKVKLDTGKFRSDLRIALINGDKVWLKYNSANEVISIIEM